jgi:tetratricopeptide (TPR) repeat protein
VLKEYTVAEADIRIPSLAGETPALSDIVLGFRTEMKGNVGLDELRTFQIGTLQIHPAAENTFILGDTVHVFFQVVGAGADFGLDLALMNGEEILQQKSTKVGDYEGPAIERFPLTNMMGGNYELRVKLLDPSGTVVSERSAPVQVSPRSNIARPWLYRSSFNTKNPGLLALARGDQLWNLKRYDEAHVEFEKAVAAGNENLPLAHWKLAESYLRMGDGDKAMELLAPMEEKFPQQYEIVAGLGFVHYLKSDYPKAVEYLTRAMQLRPADTVLLNTLGESFIKVGDKERAIEALERSLAMNPDQEDAKSLLASVKP